MGLSERVLPAATFFMSFGVLGYAAGSVMNLFFSSITPQVAGAVFGFAALSVELGKGSKESNSKKN